jgi:hypothetical protein
MFDKLKRMFEDERASPVWCTACAKGIDTLICGGQGMLRGVFVPISNQLMKLIFG